MPEKQLVYKHGGKDYVLIIRRKKMKNIRYTYKDGVFKVSAPHWSASEKQIIQGLDKYADQLIKADVRSKASSDNFIYILGEKVTLHESGEIPFTDGSVITYKNREDLNKNLAKWFLKVVEPRHRYYEKIMGIKKPYKVKIRKMTTRYGTNSLTTHSITYSLVLVHYSIDVVDSIIIHELAHEFVRNHSKQFYDVVYKYCPDYKQLHRRLRKGEFA